MKIGEMKPGNRLYVSLSAIVESLDQENTPGYFINQFVTGHPEPDQGHVVSVEKRDDGSLVATVPKHFSARKMWITPRENKPNLKIRLVRK